MTSPYERSIWLPGAPRTSWASDVELPLYPPTMSAAATALSPLVQYPITIRPPELTVTEQLLTPPAPAWSLVPPLMGATASMPTPSVLVAPGLDSHAASSIINVFSPVDFSYTHVLGSTANYIILALIADNEAFYSFDGSNVTASVKVGSSTMSSLGYVDMNGSAAQGFVWVFGLANPPTGSQTITADFTANSGTWGGFFQTASWAFNNVSAVGSLITNYGDSQSPLVELTTTANGHCVWGLLGTNASATFTPATGEGSLISDQTSSTPSWFAVDAYPTGSSQILTATMSADTVWAAVGLDMT